MQCAAVKMNPPDTSTPCAADHSSRTVAPSTRSFHFAIFVAFHDWALLEAAIDQKIEDQRQFVAWWDGNVREGGRPLKTAADPGRFSQAQAEKISNITNQQVSRWRKSLQDPDAYRAKLRGAVWAKATAPHATEAKRAACRS